LLVVLFITEQPFSFRNCIVSSLVIAGVSESRHSIKQLIRVWQMAWFLYSRDFDDQHLSILSVFFAMDASWCEDVK